MQLLFTGADTLLLVQRSCKGANQVPLGMTRQHFKEECCLVGHATANEGCVRIAIQVPFHVHNSAVGRTLGNTKRCRIYLDWPAVAVSAELYV